MKGVMRDLAKTAKLYTRKLAASIKLQVFLHWSELEEFTRDSSFKTSSRVLSLYSEHGSCMDYRMH